MSTTLVRSILIAALLLFVGCGHIDTGTRPDDDPIDRVRERTR